MKVRAQWSADERWGSGGRCGWKVKRTSNRNVLPQHTAKSYRATSSHLCSAVGSLLVHARPNLSTERM